jgi:hypothetical protein
MALTHALTLPHVGWVLGLTAGLATALALA